MEMIERERQREKGREGKAERERQRGKGREGTAETKGKRGKGLGERLLTVLAWPTRICRG